MPAALRECGLRDRNGDDVTNSTFFARRENESVFWRSAKASRELPTPYGMFSIVYDGKQIAERPVSATRFRNIMSKLA
jgi:hypothetical protein